MSISNIIALQDGEWVNDPFTCYVQSAEAKSKPGGTTRISCTFLDDQDHNVKIYGSIWGRGDASKIHGKVIRVSGQGVKKDSYNGNPQLSISDKATIDIIGEPVTKQTGGSSKAPSKENVPGVTVGMAINNAVQIAISHGKMDRFTLKHFVYDTASDLIRVSRKLESGALADKVGTAPPERPSPPADERPDPEPTGGFKMDGAIDIDDDVPF